MTLLAGGSALGGQVTVHMAASPREVWELVSDITRIGEFSPETFEAEWRGGATGPAVGARFRGHVKRTGTGVVYWSPCQVTACVPDQEFGFAVVVGGRPVNNWHYRLTPSGSGTDVTESFRIDANLASRVYWTLFGRGRGKTNLYGMEQTLLRMKAVLEGA